MLEGGGVAGDLFLVWECAWDLFLCHECMSAVQYPPVMPNSTAMPGNLLPEVWPEQSAIKKIGHVLNT